MANIFGIDLTGSDMDDAQQEYFHRALKTFEAAFARHPNDLGRTTAVEHEINTQGAAP